MPLKRPVTLPQARRWPAAAARRESFCARMGGMRERLTGERAARDPASPINRALAAWDCDKPELLQRKHVSKGIRMRVTSSKVGSESRKAPARKNPDNRRAIAELVRRSTVQRTNANSMMVWQIIGPNGEVLSGPPGKYPGKEGPLSGSATMGKRGWKTKREASAALIALNQKADSILNNPAAKRAAPARKPATTWAVFKVGIKTPLAVFASRADAVAFGQSWADIHKAPVQVIAG